MTKIEDISEEIKESAMDMIRTGTTLEEYQKLRKMHLGVGLSEDQIKDYEFVFFEHKKGNLKIDCTEKDKKRIIRKHVLRYVKMGSDVKDAKESVKRALTSGILIFNIRNV